MQQYDEDTDAIEEEEEEEGDETAEEESTPYFQSGRVRKWFINVNLNDILQICIFFNGFFNKNIFFCFWLID